jgi:predicted dithiol-disulfide oxidoreductase (DUF899 family)
MAEDVRRYCIVQFTNLTTESAGYRSAREDLRQAEVELMHHREKVAEMRRALPLGPLVSDYEFVECTVPGPPDNGSERAVRLDDLFTAPGRPLIVYHLMYGKQQTSPCPMCTMWIDGFNGIAHHVVQNADFVIVAAADVDSLRTFALERGWTGLRLLSAGDSTFKYDFGSEDTEGNQDSRVSVFAKDADGAVRHTYTSSPHMSADVFERGIDLLCPTWHLLDLTPVGRGDWYASLSYATP